MVRKDGNSTDFNDVHPPNALEPKVVTESAATFVNEVHP